MPSSARAEASADSSSPCSLSAIEMSRACPPWPRGNSKAKVASPKRAAMAPSGRPETPRRSATQNIVSSVTPSKGRSCRRRTAERAPSAQRTSVPGSGTVRPDRRPGPRHDHQSPRPGRRAGAASALRRQSRPGWTTAVPRCGSARRSGCPGSGSRACWVGLEAEAQRVECLRGSVSGWRDRAGEHALGEPELVVDLHGSGLDGECPGLSGRSGLGVDDHGWHAAPSEHEPGHQPGGSCADDEHVGGGDG